MQFDDIETVVKVHLCSFRGFFLSFLGPAFLRELYLAIIGDGSGIAWVFQSGEDIIGFVAGTSQPADFYHRLLRQRWWRFGLAAIPAMFRNPLIVPRLLRTFRKPQESASQPDTGTLMSIAVLPESQRQGVSQVLVGAFLEEAKQRDLKQVNLTTDRDNINPVNHIYRKLYHCVINDCKIGNSN